MNDQNKKYIGWGLVVALLLIGFAGMRVAGAYSDSVSFASSRTFTATGTGKVVAIPDVATFTVGVLTQGGKDLTVLQKENTDKVNAVVKYIRDKGVASADIETSQYSVDPRYNNVSCPQTFGTAVTCPPATVVGYSINTTISVKVRKFETIGDILTGVITAGANNVSQLSFTIDNPEKVKSDARAKAIASAREQADAVARAAGFRVGRIISVDESGYNPVPYAYDTYSKLSLAGGVANQAVAPTIEPGSQNVTETVTIRYEIQ